MNVLPIQTERRLLLALIMAAGMLLGVGCSNWKRPHWNLRGQPDTATFSEWGGVQRPRDSERNAWSFSEKARQIERDLGVH